MSFVAHALTLADHVVMLLPERFTRIEQRNAAIKHCKGTVQHWLVGTVRPAKFDLGAAKLKEITQPSIIVVFQRL